MTAAAAPGASRGASPRPSTAKSLVKLAILAFVGLGALLALSGLSAILTSVTTSDETEDVFNIAAQLPPSLTDAVDWLPDTEGLPRAVEPLTRDDLRDTWLRAWSQYTVLAETGDTTGLEVYFSSSALDASELAAAGGEWDGLPPRQINHELRVDFYSEDGQVVALEATESTMLRAFPTGPTGDGPEALYIADESFEAVLLLEDGNWRVQHLVRRSADGYWWSEPPPAATGMVPEDALGVTYAPRYATMSHALRAWHPGLVEQDLANMAAAGVTDIRIVLDEDELGGRRVPAEVWRNAIEFLDLAEAAGIRVTPVLFPADATHDVEQWDAQADWARSAAAVFAEHPAVEMVDLADGLDLSGHEPHFLDAWVNFMTRSLRDLDAATPVTVTWSTPEAAMQALPLTDAISFGYTGDAAGLGDKISEVSARAPGKPVLVSGYSAHSWSSVFPGGSTEVEQSAASASAVIAARQSKANGLYLAAWWDLAEPAGLLPWKAGPVGATGVVRADGTPKPAAAVFSADADLGSLRSVGPLHRFTKPFWLLVLLVGGSLFVARSQKMAGVRRRIPAQLTIGRVVLVLIALLILNTAAQRVLGPDEGPSTTQGLRSTE